MGPVPDPTLSRKFGSAGNRTQDLWVATIKSDRWTTEALES
jgi:hypothetical protein